MRVTIAVISCAAPALLSIVPGCGDDDGASGDDASARFDAGALPTDGGNDASATLDADRFGDAATFDAGSDAGRETCPTPGAAGTVVCGRCGLARRVCGADGYWGPAEACLSEGECAAGEVETETLAMCAERARICDDTCAFRAWSMTRPPGACTPAEMRVDRSDCAVGSVRLEICSALCAWEPAPGSTCGDACGGTPRTTPADAEEICVGAGPFMRGSASIAASSPIAEVMISAFYIDRFPVTNSRYAACVTAGACTLPPAGSLGRMALLDPTRARHPTQEVSFANARAFCTWDGARRLPTSAEWEKAARGPSPRGQRHTWDEDSFRCDLLRTAACGYVPDPTDHRMPDLVDAWPGTRSYYGAELMIGGVWEWTTDFSVGMPYTDPGSRLPDPMGPATDTGARVVRGMPRFGTVDSQFDIASLGEGYESAPDEPSGVRCVRRAPGL